MQRRYEELLAWQKAHALTLAVYRLTSGYPRDEVYGLVSQMRRAAVSTAANIAEGHSRHSRNEFRHFLSIACGSANELDYYLTLSLDLGYIDTRQYENVRNQSSELLRILTGLFLAMDQPSSGK